MSYTTLMIGSTNLAVSDLHSRIISRAQAFVQDDLLQHGSVMAVATIMAGVLNYTFQIFMGRALQPEQYGAFGALFALFYLVNMLGRGIRFSSARFAAEFSHQKDELAQFYRGMFTRTAVFSCGCFMLLVAASPLIAKFLSLGSVWLVIIVVAITPFSLTLTANLGVFQGNQWFVALGSTNVLVSAIKLLLGVGLVLLGFGVYGAFSGMIIALFVVLIVTTLYLRGRMPAEVDGFDFEYRRAYRFMLPAVLAGFCMNVPANVDVILVKALFTSQEAGFYTSVSVLGKALIFLPMGISTALFPKVSQGMTTETPSQLDALFNRAILYTAAIAGFGALIYWVAPTFILELFFGSAYTAAAPFLQWYGAAILAFALAAVVLNFQLALGRMRYVYLFAALSVAEIALLWMFSASMVQFIQIILVMNAVLFTVGIAEVKS